MRIVIGYDGSAHSDAAIDDLRLAGLPDDTEIRIVSVADLLISAPEISQVIEEAATPLRIKSELQKARTHAEQLHEEAEKTAGLGLERVRRHFPQWNAVTKVMNGTPAWALIDAATEWNADLVVVGSHGHSTLKRLFLGSVSKRVVTDSPTSVRVARPRERALGDAPPRILAGVDGSPAAEVAVHAVGQRAWPAGTEVLLVSADDSSSTSNIASRLPQAAAMIDHYFKNREERVAQMIDWAKAELETIGIGTTVIAKKGDAKSILLSEAERWQADTIFVGTRDLKNAFERFRLGSVSTAIVTNAACSVEVIRPGGGSIDQDGEAAAADGSEH